MKVCQVRQGEVEEEGEDEEEDAEAATDGVNEAEAVVEFLEAEVVDAI